jgi:predicted nicotinamide N-methyase
MTIDHLPDFAIKFKLKIEKREFELYRIKDIDTLFSKLLNKLPGDIDVTDERMPYWADVWPSAIALAQYLMRNKVLVASKDVIELGCGLGLPGMVAASLDAKMIMSDYLDEAIAFAKLNWEHNLDLPFTSEKIDWRSVDDTKQYDVILASDVAYESRSFRPLIVAMKNLLKKDGVILISEPNRKFASPFIELLSKELSVTKTDHDVRLDELDYKISIYQCRLKK